MKRRVTDSWTTSCVEEIPVQVWTHIAFKEVEVPIYYDNRHTKILRLSTLHSPAVFTPAENISGIHFC
jgi:hypothetical protein